MADEVDAGNEMADKLNAAYLSIRKPEGPPAIGECLSCSEPLPDDKRWCNAECRDTWQIRNRR